MRLPSLLTSGSVAVPVVVGLLAGILLLMPLGSGEVGEVVRVVVGLPFVLVLPGFVLSRAVLPAGGRPGCSSLERVCWTLALDMALLVAGALLLNALPAGLSSTSWTVFLLLVLAAAGFAARVREGQSLRPRPPAWSRPRLRRLVIGGAAMVIAGAAIGLAVASEATKADPAFSQLWLVPEEPGPPGAVPPAGLQAPAAAVVTAQLGVQSEEDGTRGFRVEVRPDGWPVQTWSFSLHSGEAWTQSVVVPDRTRTEALLYRGSDPMPYRQVWSQP